MICDPENTVFVSAVSRWEIWLKQSLGKLRLPGDFTERLAAESFESLPLVASQTRQVSLLPGCHRDPFDRMLIAQAQVERLVLVTGNEFLVAYGPSFTSLADYQFAVWWQRCHWSGHPAPMPTRPTSPFPQLRSSA
jgi:PIN domain nuclease of toxin-antitoxin system